MTSALVVLGGYLLGSMPFGYWVVLLVKGEDIRKVGSGNIGASNVWRTYGRWLGIPIVVLDVAKGFVPALVGALLVGELTAVLAGGAAMLGHWRPLFLRFQKGGKTVATGGGVFLGAAPLLGLIGVAVWVVAFLVTRYASLASIVAALSLPVLAVLARRAVADRRLRRDRGSRRLLLHRPNIAPPARGNREPLPATAAGEARLGGASQSASEVCRSGGVPDSSSARSSPTVPSRSARTSCAWIVSKLSWRAKRKSPSASSGIASSAPLSESRTESSTNRGWRWACSTTNSSSGRFSSS